MVRRQTYSYQFSYPINPDMADSVAHVDVYMTSPAGRTVVRVQRNGSESMATWRARTVQATLWSKADRNVLSAVNGNTVMRHMSLRGSRVQTDGAHDLVWIRAPPGMRSGHHLAQRHLPLM